MNPIIALPFAALGVGYWWTRRRRKSKNQKQGTPGAAVLPPEERGPLDGPGGQEPPQPEPDAEQPEPEQPQPAPEQSFPGPHMPHDPHGEHGSVPVPMYVDATQAQIEQWPGHALHVFISIDCKTVLVGSEWLQKIFLPAAAELVDDPQRYHSVAALTWEILVQPFADRPGINAAADCLAKLPDFLFSQKTKFGTFSPYATNYERYSAAWDVFARRFPELVAFYASLSDALESHPKVRPILDANWNDDSAEG